MKNKRILAALLSIVMILTQIPASTYADILQVSQVTTAVESTDKSEDNNTSKSADTEADESALSTQSDSEEGEAVLWTFMNDNYPYGKDMTSSQLTLVIDVDGTASSYQWQSATDKDGEYTDIAGETSATYTITSPSNGMWYRCVVDGVESKAVETVYPNQDRRTWTKPYSSWYISNGKMAYMANGSIFDVVGLYTKNNNEYMLCTSYGRYWNMFSNSSAVPAAGDTSASGLDALRVAFNDNDDYDVIFEADLADGQQSFSFGCDTQLGNSSTSGEYSDYAALKAIFKNKKFQQVSMIGSATFNTAADDDPSFVIAPITDNSIFWIGYYSSRKTYSYYEMDSVSTGYRTKKIDGKNVVTLLEGRDSGMTMSWLNLDSGSSVKFRFGVGSVKDTGAVSGKVDYANEKITGLDPSTVYEITVDGDDDTKYTISSDSKGEIPLAGEDNDGNAYDFVGKSITIAKASNPDASADIDVSGRPDTPQNPSDLENGSSSRPEIVEKIEITELTTDSVTISPISGQQYAYSEDGENWTILDDTYKDEDGNYKVTGLNEGGKVYIKTRKSATANEPASEWSSVTELTLKSTIKAEVSGYEGQYDGEEHTITVVPTNVEDAVITYSLSRYDGYSTEIPKITDYYSSTVYYRIEKDGYYPLCGSAYISISQRPLTINWSDTTFVYDGTEKLPTAEVEGVLEKDRDNCSLNIGLYYVSSAVNAGTYTAYATVSNSNYSLDYNDRQKEFVIEKADKAKPEGLTTTAESIYGKNDGTIIGLTTDMEYRKVTEDASDDIVYTSVTEEDVAAGSISAGGGTYAVRYKEETNYKASPDTLITVEEGKKYTITLPAEDEQIGYTITTGKDWAGWNENVTLTFTLNPGCTKSDDFSITVNGKKIDNIGQDGTFTYTIENVNEDITISVTGVSDKVPPTGEIKSGETGSWSTFISDIVFNHFVKGRQQVTITASDEGSGIKSVEYYVYTPTAGKNGLSLPEVKTLADWTEGTELYINPADKCVIYAKITDRAGNVAYISSNGIALDNITPVIEGITEGKAGCENIEFTASDDNLASVSYQVENGDIIELQVNSDGKYVLPVEDILKQGTEAKNISVIATDKAGNSKVITISAAHEFEEKVVAPTVLHKGYTEYVCKDCERTYKSDYESALGESGLTPNDKEELISIRNGAQEIINKDELSEDEEDKEFYNNLIQTINSMLDGIQQAEELIKAIDDINIPDITNPTIDDSDKLNEALTKINDLLDEDKEETPTQSLTDEQKEKLESLKESVAGKLDTVTKANDELKAVKEGTEKEAGVDTINKIENIQPEDQDKIESVLAKLENLSNNYNNNLTEEQQNTVKDYYNQMIDKLKEAASKDIDKKLEDTKKYIEVSFADAQAKEEAISKAAEEAVNAKEAVQNGKTKEEVVKAREDGIQALDSITGNIDDFKNDVKNSIESIFTEKKNEISNMPDLTSDEKQEALDKLEADKNSAYEALENNKTKSEAYDVLDDVTAKFNETADELEKKDFSNAKDNAKNEIAKKAEETKKAIDAMPNLTDEEKEAAKNEVEKEAQAVTEAIDNVTDPADKSELTSKKNDGIKRFDEIEDSAANNDLDNLKEAVKTDIDSRAKDAKEAIDNMSDLTSEEKEAAKAEIDKKVEAAKKAVGEVTDTSKKDEVKAQKDTITADIKKQQDTAADKDLSNAKDKAKDEIAKRAEETKKAIDAMPNLTYEEKEAAKKNVDEEAKAATEAIDKITKPSDKSEVALKKNDGIKKLDAVEEKAANDDFTNIKEAAKTDIDSRAEDAKEAIDNMQDLTSEEKEAAKAEIDKKVEAAKKAVDEITDTSKKDEIKSQKDTVTAEIKKQQDIAADKDLSNAKDNVVKAEEAAKKAAESIGDIRVSAVDEDSIKEQIREELKKAGLDNVDVEVNNFKKTPATLHTKGKITGTVEVKAGSTTKIVEIDTELPELSTYVNYESIVEEGAPKAEVLVDEDVLMDNVLGEDECAELMNGSNANIALNIKNKDAIITDNEAELIAEKLADNMKVGKYLDITLYLNIVDSNGTPIVTNEKISESKTKFTIKVNIPEELWAAEGTNRVYQIVRIHNGVAEVIASVYDEAGHTLTFETDRFSTYAIAYSDENSTVTDDKNDDNSNAGITEDTVSGSGNEETSDGASAATGDKNSTAGWILLMALALAGMLTLTVSKKRKSVK